MRCVCVSVCTEHQRDLQPPAHERPDDPRLLAGVQAILPALKRPLHHRLKRPLQHSVTNSSCIAAMLFYNVCVCDLWGRGSCLRQYCLALMQHNLTLVQHLSGTSWTFARGMLSADTANCLAVEERAPGGVHIETLSVPVVGVCRTLFVYYLWNGIAWGLVQEGKGRPLCVNA